MTGFIRSTIREFLSSEALGGVVLVVTAALALIIANSPLADRYFAALQGYIGPLSVLHWINDGLMAIFFLMVGLEIKREMMDGHLSNWSRRILPGGAAVAGMIVLALFYLAFAGGQAAQGWAIPAATDIAFALGVIALLGPRVPASLKVFLAALAIIDDLGAVVIIGLFYSTGFSVGDLAGVAIVLVALLALNRMGVMRLWPYLILGGVLWVFMVRSGIHATVAGVLVAFCVPLAGKTEMLEATESPLHRLEHALLRPVAFFIVPIFAFANEGVCFAGFSVQTLLAPVTLGVASGLALGKVIGIFGAVWVLVRTGLAELPAGANWAQVLGTATLCGIGFTMSLFISLLAFDTAALQSEAKFGILAGSLFAGIAGYLVLRLAKAGRGEDVLES